MSSPPPPPPPNPATATTTAAGNATADFFKSVARQRPRKHAHPAIYQTFYNHQPSTTTTPPFPPPPPQRHHQQPPPQLHSNLRTQNQQQSTAGGGGGGLLYPVASSGRGFLSKHQQQQPNSDQIANSDGFPPRPTSANPYLAGYRPYGFSNSDIPGQTSHHLVNPSNPHLQQTFIGSGTVMPTVSANPKVSGQAPVADDNNLKSIRDKNGDDSFVIIRDRKVQVSEGSSLYAQCRSWLKNGSTLENQPQYVDCVKSLPKPLPASMVEPRKEDDIEIEEPQKTEDVEQLSAKELLQQHIKHAKKVRGRLRNQRLQRIERYKDRLALLLPPVVDQQPKNDPTS